MRDKIMQSVKDAMKGGDKARLAALRMVQAKIKDADIAARPSREKISEPEIIDLLAKMVKQRRESIELYKQGGRPELADAEQAEITVIEGFMPKQLGEADISAAITALIKDTGAASVKDMGKVMAALKEKYAGQMDFAKASGMVKGLLK
ncbi:MAG: GatB/YqeY domain-containing protein [Hyphomicrobiaceae bacterium]